MNRSKIIWLSALVPAIAAVPAAAQSLEERPQISVSADASVEVEPDRAIVDLAVETQAETAQAATRENAERMSALVAELRRLGIPDERIRTISFQLHPIYTRPRPTDTVPPERRIAAYRAVNMVRVTTDSIAGTGALIDAAVARGGNRVANIRFELRDPSSARAEALRRATRIAREEAAILAAALDVTLGEPLRVSTSYARPMPQPMMAVARMDAREEMQSVTPVEGGTIEVRADVHIVFAIQR
ncbi:MAG TPA: SIMPL domain-containing protein [Longimicrobiales bacterium]|nr:SIMPL domain-containing protein [Longimicrobiales bacterium]